MTQIDSSIKNTFSPDLLKNLNSSETNVSPDDKKSPPDTLTENIKDRQSDRVLREKMANKSFKIAMGGVIIWIVVLVFYTYIKVVFEKTIFTDYVLIAITTATTINVFTSFVVVVKGLFFKK